MDKRRLIENFIPLVVLWFLGVGFLLSLVLMPVVDENKYFWVIVLGVMIAIFINILWVMPESSSYTTSKVGLIILSPLAAPLLVGVLLVVGIVTIPMILYEDIIGNE
jgi:hypothetical protein